MQNVEASTDFIKAWNSAFIKTFKWKEVNKLTLEKRILIKKSRIILPWHPLIFRDDFKSNIKNKKFKFIDKYPNIIYGLICLPEHKIERKENFHIFKNCQILHYIDIENESIGNIFKNYKSRVRTKIRAANKKFTFTKINSVKEFENLEIAITNLLVEQNIRFSSPSPPIYLIKNLLKNKVVEIILVFKDLELVGFAVLSMDCNISSVIWSVKSINLIDNDLSISMYHYCLKESLNRKVKIFSLGTTSSESLGKFKEQLNAKRAILFKGKITFNKFSKGIFYASSNRSKFNLTLMRYFLKVVLSCFGKSAFVYVGKAIWQRFD